jgi:hypothetical protein
VNNSGKFHFDSIVVLRLFYSKVKIVLKRFHTKASSLQGEKAAVIFIIIFPPHELCS